MKVFLGNNNIANILTGFKKGFEYNNIEVVSLEKEPSQFYDSNQFHKIYRFFKFNYFKNSRLNKLVEKIDYTIQNYRCKRYIKKHINKVDVFVFFWHSAISDFSDYELIKKANKKIITLFAGSDVRYSKAFSNQYHININEWEDDLVNDDLNEKLNFVRRAEIYSDVILSVPDQSGLMISDYNHFFLPVDLLCYQYTEHQNDIPLLLHAPTRNGIKGTDFFIDVVKKLKKEGLLFEFKLIQNIKHTELIKLLSQSDILLDELYLHGPGMLATEAMALGCVVVTKKDNSIKHIFDAPVCDVDFNTVYTKLKQLILSKEQRIAIAQKARLFVEEKNDCKHVVRQLLNNLTTNHRDYSPSYYVNNQDKPWLANISEHNSKLTQAVFDTKKHKN